MEDMKGAMGGGKCEHCGGNHACCGGGMLGMGHRHGSRLLIMIVVALIIFWMGAQYGELKAFARHGGMMGGYGAYGYDAGFGPENASYGPGMMTRTIINDGTTSTQ